MVKMPDIQLNLPHVFHKSCVDCRNLVKHTHCECDEASSDNETDEHVRMMDEGCPNVD